MSKPKDRLAVLKRRVSYLEGLPYENSYMLAEISALSWAITYIEEDQKLERKLHEAWGEERRDDTLPTG